MLAVAVMMVAGATPLMAQTSNPATSPAVAQPGALRITVVAVQGGAQYRNDGDTKWHALTADAHLVEGVEFRTGPKGTIQFTVGTDQIYRVDRLTVLKVLRAVLGADGTIKTDVGMEYGRVSKDVDAPIRPHDDTIVTPSSTLAVRGTRVSLYDQPPYEPEAISLTGAAVFASLGNQLSAFGAKNQGKAVVTAANPNAASNAINTTIVDPSDSNARTPSEQKLLADVITNGSVVNVNNPVTLPVVSNTGFPATTQLMNLYSGDLIFYVRWNTDTHVQMQLSTHNSSGIGEFILPVLGLNRTASGGQILFDNLGGPTGGYEVIVYDTADFPNKTTYAIAATNLGSVPTTLTFDAFITNSYNVIPSERSNALVPQGLIDPNSQTFQAQREVVQTNIVPGESGGVLALVDKESPNQISGSLGGIALAKPASSTPTRHKSKP
jgi:hypothetical protein